MLRTNLFSIVLGLVLSSSIPAATADTYQDGFTTNKTVETKYFTLYLAEGIDEVGLAHILDIGPKHKILAGQPLRNDSASPDNLGMVVDALFGWSSGILDMRLHNYKGAIKVARTTEEIKNIAIKLYGHEAFSERAFYIYELDTIYIAASDFTKEILGHEMAHAIINHFFVVQPPEKVQEVLAGYIEYQLHKLSTP